MRLSIVLSALLLFVACGSGSGSEESSSPDGTTTSTTSEIALRPAFAELHARVATAEDTYDLEDLIDELSDSIRVEFRNSTQPDWRPHATSLANLPHEAAAVADAIVARWEELGVVHDGVNHDGSLERIRGLGRELADECYDQYYSYVFQEIVEAERPDVTAMTALMASCARLYASADAKTRREWDDSLMRNPEQMLAIVASPDSIRVLRERR